VPFVEIVQAVARAIEVTDFDKRLQELEDAAARNDEQQNSRYG
jgi:hypothetical protein